MWLCSLCYTLIHALIFLAKPSVVASMAGLPLITETESSESEADETENSGNATGGKTSGLPQKRKKYSCSYRKEYNKRFPWATDSKKGPSYAFCMPCGRDISLAQGGTKDLRKHEQTTVHTKAHQGTSGIKPLHSYFGPVRNEDVIVAEVKFGYFLGEHHLAFLLADHCNRLFCSCSLILYIIAKDFKCGQTKATAIAYATDYRPPNVPRVELLTHRLYDHRTCTSWKNVLYPSKWCLFRHNSLRAVLHAVEVSFDQSLTTHTYYRLYIYHLYIIYWPLRISSHYFTVLKINYASTIYPTVSFRRMMRLLHKNLCIFCVAPGCRAQEINHRLRPPNFCLSISACC